ncbi:ABC transporter ATP-binding protein [Streptomyces sp. NPDC015131]|uniref:ABC transporter ATP-binding protein n=1 Tax=Streptomyces sp. NPDC015131 TaxID=3364941 RepID=UPI0036F72BF9
MYQLSCVTKRYRRGEDTVRALDGVDLIIEDGGRLVVHGPAGGGKSTFLRMLGGLDRPCWGRVLLDGTDLATLPEARLARLRAEKIGFVSRVRGPVPGLTVQEYVETGLVPLGLRGDERRERAAEALVSVGLGGRGGHPLAGLPDGQRQRAAIARAWVGRPAVLLADEPAGGLDAAGRDAIMEVLDGLWERHGLTFVMVTRDTALARRAPRVATLREGRMSVREQVVG